MGNKMTKDIDVAKQAQILLLILRTTEFLARAVTSHSHPSEDFLIYSEEERPMEGSGFPKVKERVNMPEVTPNLLPLLGKLSLVSWGLLYAQVEKKESEK